ncbi:LamG-like jellyroll fold domain-containing protein [Neolewinella litorea]|nr:LamG-like jellyroll fold domain-containing protein [Neolewinella litorea]
MRLFLCLLCCLPLSLFAQVSLGLTASYPFEGNLGDATGDAGNLGVPEGAVDYDCGAQGEAILLTAAGDYVRIPGGGSNNVNRIFDDNDFSLSLYFKSIDGGSAEQYLIAKRDSACGDNRLFVRYAPAGRRLTAQLQQGNVVVTLTHVIDNASCFQHVTLTREATAVTLYLNGQAVASQSSSARLDIDNTGDLLIGAAPCYGAGEGNFRGLIDEVRLFNRALPSTEVRQLYRATDRIVSQPGQIFLGQSIQVDLRSNCGTAFSWTPTTGVVSPTDAEPVITPTEEGRLTYEVAISDDISSCIARDSMVIRVINPDSLRCNEVFLPKAFTPNGIGPELNETFGISNPFAVSQLISFEIYDRYGGRLFATTDPFARWDGEFQGQPVSPGVLLYRLVYRCNEEELVRSGSLTILR